MAPSPKRRWFRFGLRTLFVVVTLLAIPLGWLAWQIQIVRERKAVLAEIRRLWRSATGFDYLGLETNQGTIGTSLNLDSRRISRLRRMLGDETFLDLSVGQEFSPSWIERMEHAFPEAELAFCDANGSPIATRDQLYGPSFTRKLNTGNVFKTGLIEK